MAEVETANVSALIESPGGPGNGVWANTRGSDFVEWYAEAGSDRLLTSRSITAGAGASWGHLRFTVGRGARAPDKGATIS